MNCSDSSFAITAYTFFEVLASICKPSQPEYKCVITALATYLPEMIDKSSFSKVSYYLYD